MSRFSAHGRLRLTAGHLSAELSAKNSRSLSQTSRVSEYGSAQVGSKFSSSFKQYAVKDNRVVSYFHDIPLSLDVANHTVSMVVEVPRWSNAKFEISTSIEGNPIVQDTKKGKVRFVRNIFPYKGYIHNYGALPQTWEDPTVKNAVGDLFGDGDPLDVCEIGSTVLPTGTIRQVKVLGSLALVDDGELDWKVIVVDVSDPLAQELHDIHDVFTVCPGLLESTRQWFRDYKIPDGKVQNKFALGGKYRSAAETMDTIVECHEAWQRLIAGKVECEVAVANLEVPGSVGKIDGFSFNDAVLGGVVEPDSKIPSEVDRIFYVSQ